MNIYDYRNPPAHLPRTFIAIKYKVADFVPPCHLKGVAKKCQNTVGP